MTTLAGTAGLAGSNDGTGAAARFNRPSGVALDSAGNIYIADSGNDTIRKLTPAGAVTTIAGSAGTPGSFNGTGAAARFNVPTDVEIDSAGTLYVADSQNDTIRKIAPTGAVTTIAGSALVEGSDDGGATARLATPLGLAIDGTGTLYIADSDNNAIRKLSTDGIVTTFVGAPGLGGISDGVGTAAHFRKPAGVAVDRAGNIFVADQNADSIRKVMLSGVVTTFAGTSATVGSADGTGPAARFYQPEGVAVDDTGTLYVADSINATIRKITTDVVVTTFAGAVDMRGNVDGAGGDARFSTPFGMATDAAHNVYVSDGSSNTIRKITADGVVSTFAGNAGKHGSDDGGTSALFNHPLSIAADASGNIYVPDAGNRTIRKIAPDGIVSTLAGTAGITGAADGTGPAASFTYPEAVAVDGAGNVYVADTLGSTIRKITPSGETTTIAGAPGVAGIVLGPRRRLANPAGLAIVGDSLVVIDTYAVLLLRHVVP